MGSTEVLPHSELLGSGGQRWVSRGGYQRVPPGGEEALNVGKGWHSMPGAVCGNTCLQCVGHKGRQFG